MSSELEQQLKNVKAELDASPPAWVVTFGDMMSLLLCFFVLLLSFSETDKQLYKEVAGSLAQAFGIQREIKALDSPKGQKMIAKDFDMQHIATREKEEFGKEIKKEIETHFKDIKDKIQVEVSKDKVTIRMMGETAFDSGKSDIRPEMMPLLEKIGSILRGGKGEIIVCGHTDNIPVKSGPFQSNLRLSIARAATVAEFLINHTGIEPSRISTMGFGEYRPLVSNDTPEGRQKNRRVEITLTTSAFNQESTPEKPSENTLEYRQKLPVYKPTTP